MTDKTINGLLIEDDPNDTLLIMDLLAKSDWPSFKFAFACAEDLRSGLKLLDENEVEVILLDLMLPDARGIETVEKVHAHAPDVPIVVLTGLQDEAMGLDALIHGAQDYQVKGSLDGHALKRTISYAVERHRLFNNLKNVIDRAPDGMVIVSAKGTVDYANPAAQALFAEPAKALLIGSPFPYPLPKGSSGELKIAAANGGESITEIRLSEMEWKDRSATLLSIRDITELRRIQQIKAEILERRKMDKLKDELISTVSHEMRSPLTIVKAATCNIKEGLTGPLSREQREMVFLQYKNIVRLEKIVDNILDLHRLESGKAIIKRENIRVERLIRDTLSGFRLLARKNRIDIAQEISPELPPIYADPELFIQVLSNLLDNALRFASAQVLIRAQARLSNEGSAPVGKEDSRGVLLLTERKYVQISVIDDGKGIPKDRIDGLFNKFVQLDRSSRGADYKGTGLGLAICKEILEHQDGRIWVESEEGRGAQFHFLLPERKSVSDDRNGDGNGKK